MGAVHNMNHIDPIAFSGITGGISATFKTLSTHVWTVLSRHVAIPTKNYLTLYLRVSQAEIFRACLDCLESLDKHILI